MTALLAGAAIVACAPQPAPLGAPRVTTPSASPPLVREVVLGVDRLIGGFNPHTLADLTPVSEAVAGLLLPSAFHQAPSGQWVLDHTLLTSAEVTTTAPFTVTYRIRRNAQWSDITPIAAEDFGYLAEQMRTQPGVLDSAGYQLIDQVISRDGGKTAEVVFTRPYAGWRTLFRHLLPAHLLKDAPGGWSKALDAGLPVSGGPFAMTSVDRSRGEIVLERNDRYWDTPTQVGRIRLRQGSEAALVEALRTGGVQGALFGRPNAITESLLRAANLGVSPTVVPQPVLISVLLRPASRV
ncbi:MAG: ABC transporter substrate-binding protein, partial [Actinomycetota bacterium]|nr:ABC transporter substrate-binding protein [Actinomycetota bacterium]